MGAFATELINKTGSASVKGSLIKIDTANDEAFVLTGADDDECIGTVLEDGVADGDLTWCVLGGVAEVLLKDGTSATRGNWVKTSDTPGRADATNADVPAPILVELLEAAAQEHMQEIGHAIQSKTAGTDVLCKVLLHFN